MNLLDYSLISLVPFSREQKGSTWSGGVDFGWSVDSMGGYADTTDAYYWVIKEIEEIIKDIKKGFYVKVDINNQDPIYMYSVYIKKVPSPTLRNLKEEDSALFAEELRNRVSSCRGGFRWTSGGVHTSNDVFRYLNISSKKFNTAGETDGVLGISLQIGSGKNDTPSEGNFFARAFVYYYGKYCMDKVKPVLIGRGGQYLNPFIDRVSQNGIDLKKWQ